MEVSQGGTDAPRGLQCLSSHWRNVSGASRRCGVAANCSSGSRLFSFKIRKQASVTKNRCNGKRFLIKEKLALDALRQLCRQRGRKEFLMDVTVHQFRKLWAEAVSYFSAAKSENPALQHQTWGSNISVQAGHYVRRAYATRPMGKCCYGQNLSG